MTENGYENFLFAQLIIKQFDYGSDQGNLLKGIVIWLVVARSVVQSPVRALDSTFSNTFSLFQLLQLFNF
jgi:hypothetical protein